MVNNNIVAKVLNHKWPPIVLVALHRCGPCRFRELMRVILRSGERTMSDPALSGALRVLGDHGLVVHQVPEDARSPYRLTDTGEAVAKALQAITDVT